VADDPEYTYLSEDCEKCRLCLPVRSVLIHPRGTDTPTVLIVGEAPGREEDKVGKPFVGPSGKMLEEVLAEAGIPLSECRITNAVRCFPMDDDGAGRPPEKDEAAACRGYLIEEIKHVRPKIIVGMGKIAATAITGSKTLKPVRGLRVDAVIDEAEGYTVPTVCTFHPAYYLRSKNPEIRGAIINDLKYARAIYEPDSIEHRTTHYKLIDTIARLRGLVDKLLRLWKADELQLGAIGVDVESAGGRGEKTKTGKVTGKKVVPIGASMFDPESRLISLQLAWARGRAALIPINHLGYTDHEFSSPAGAAVLQQELKRLLESGIPLAGSNFSFDYKYILTKLGIRPLNIVFDAMHANHCCYGGANPSNLDYMATAYLGFPPYKREIKAQIEAGKIEAVPIQELVDYGCGDSDATLQLKPILLDELDRVGRRRVYDRLYLRSQRVSLTEMEINGVQVDPKRLQKLDPYYSDRMLDAQLRVRQSPQHATWSRLNKKKNTRLTLRGKPIPNAPEYIYPDLKLGSWQDVQSMMYDVFEFPDRDARGKEDRSTDADHVRDHGLRCFESNNEEALDFLRDLLTYRNAQKRRSSYVRKLLHETPNQGATSTSPFIEPGHPEWVAHPTYNQARVVTGRLSASDPPIQTIPRHSPIRGAFVSRYKSGLILKGDFSQMELRVLACLAADERLIAVLGGKDERFKQFKGDLHLYTASVIYKKKPEDVHEDERHRAKSVSFGIIYGRGPEAIALETGMTVEEAKALIDLYFETFPKVKAWVEAMHEQVHTEGLITGPTGRLYVIPEGKLSNSGRRLSFEDEKKVAKAERLSVNYPIQGSASDIALESLNRISLAFRKRSMKTLPFTFVHDSIECDTVPAELFDAYRILRDKMLGGHGDLFTWLTVPLKVEFELGADWEKTMKCEFDGNILKLSGNGKFYPPIRNRLSTHFALGEESLTSHGIKSETSTTGPRLSLEDIEERPAYEKVSVTLELLEESE